MRSLEPKTREYAAADMGRASSALPAAPKPMDCLINLRRVLSFIVASSCKFG